MNKKQEFENTRGHLADMDKLDIYSPASQQKGQESENTKGHLADKMNVRTVVKYIVGPCTRNDNRK